MELWMYLVVIGMFLIAIVATVWMTLWTIRRGEWAREARGAQRPDGDAAGAGPRESPPA